MPKIHIDRLEVSGQNQSSSIDFGKNVTIISGPSDTGKTYIYKCIDYIFGAKKDNQPFDPETTGYNKIKVYLTTDIGNITIEREIGTNSYEVYKKNKNEESTKTYSSSTINDLFMEILGLPNDLKVPKNVDGKPQAFTWRTLKTMLMIHEDTTEIEKSILLPDNQTATTGFLSCLLTILYKQDLSDYNSEDSDKIKTKKTAVMNYIEESRKNLLAKKDELEKLLVSELKDDKNDFIDEIKKEIEELQKEIDDIMLSESSFNKEIIETQTEIRHSNILLNRYKLLEEQYTSDIERLTFISSSKKILSNIPKKSNCPICHSELTTPPVIKNKNYEEATKAELQRTIDNLNGLTIVISDINDEIESLQSKLSKLNDSKNSIRSKLDEVLLPKKNTLITKLNAYNQYNQIKAKLDIIGESEKQFDVDYEKYDKLENNINYAPKDILTEKQFATDIATYYKEILTAIGYKYKECAFDISTFDIVIDGEKKKEHGKGYRSFLNSTMIMAMRKYINEKAQINPHFYFIDSPLHGLKLNEEIYDDDNIRAGFFNYVVNNAGEDQIILIENTELKDLPLDIDNKARVYRFIGNDIENPENKRRGFFQNYKN